MLRRTVPAIVAPVAPVAPAFLVALALLAGACAPGPAPSTRVTERLTIPTPVAAASRAPASVAPASQTSPLASSDQPLACPDPSIPPGSSPAFTTDYLEGNAGRDIASAWVDGLARLYAGDAAADPCDLFTGPGLQAARAADPRLRAALDGVQTMEVRPALRIAFEGSYDLRVQPPTVPMTVIFDLPAGTTVTDIPSGVTTTAATAERVGLGVTFAFDGATWRAGDVMPATGEDARWAVMPTPLPIGDPCTGLRRDPVSAGFDVRADEGGRIWCDASGKGRVIRQPDQLAMLTRYPCDRGHVAALMLGNPVGAPLDPLHRYEYLRDPKGEALDAGWIDERWRPKAKIPADAASTGWTNGNIELWVSPSRVERGVYLRLGDAFEWWPRASPDGWGVMDCN